MNETEKRGTVVEAIVGIIFLFAVIIFFIYKVGGNKDTITNSQINNSTTTAPTDKEILLNQLNSSSSENLTYNKYLKQLYDLQTGVATNTGVSEIVQNYQNELEQKVTIPNQTVQLNNISNTFNKQIYKQNFELLFANFKAKGGTSESTIFLNQIVDNDTLLPLSDYDKQTLLRLSVDYQNFADEVSKLPTPTIYLKLGTEIATKAMNISYILKQMQNEPDKKIYILWINKYSQNMNAIITDRYAIDK